MEGESKYAVIKFYSDEKFATCAKRHKVHDQVGLFMVGHEVSIQWTKKKWREALLSSQTVSVYLTAVILQRLDYFIIFTEDVCMWKCNNFVINRQDVVQIHYFRLRSLKPSLTVNPGNLRMCDILLKVMLRHP